MDKQNRQGAIRALLVSTSVIALAATWTLRAEPSLAAGTEVNDTTVTGVAISAAQSSDYILISNSTITADGIVNQGSIGTVSPNATGIMVIESAITGGIANSGNLDALEMGIDIHFSEVSGGIVNSGNIRVGSDVAGGDVEEASGIAIASTNIDIAISNSGLVSVVASDVATGPSDDAEAYAQGIVAHAFTNLNAAVDNDGTLSVSATATGGARSDAEALGIWMELAPSEAPSPVSAIGSVTNSSSSTIDVSAIAEASSSFLSATAIADAVGIAQHAESATDTTFSASNSGSLMVESMATAIANSADAIAFSNGFGILQTAEGTGSGSALLTAMNSGLIQVSSIASATATSFASQATGEAEAVGIAQDFNFSGAMTSNVTNSGDISVMAEASVDAPDAETAARVLAQGIRQTANGGESSGLNSSLSVNQTGNIDVSALVQSDGRANGTVRATAQGILQQSEGVDTATLSVMNAGNIAVSASADGEFNSSFSFHDAITAYAAGIDQESFAFLGSDQTISSSGSIMVTASAGLDETLQTDNATAIAFGTNQMASGYGEINVTSDVMGDIDVMAAARAISSESATSHALATGVNQQGQSYDDAAQLTATTDGNTNVTAIASAEGSSGADASASATGIWQSAEGANFAGAAASNNGTMTISAQAKAEGGEGDSYANAFGAGILQDRSDGLSEFIGQFAPLGVSNTSFSTIDVSVVAEALGDGFAAASGRGVGIGQNIARSADAPANADNSGGIKVAVVATAENSDDFTAAYAYASGQGIAQSVFSSSGTVSGNITSGVMTVTTESKASASGASSEASAHSRSVGLEQSLSSDASTVFSSVTSSSSLDVSAVAGAEASSGANALAEAFGSRQTVSYSGPSVVNYANSGNVSVSAAAMGDGSSSRGTAYATGAYIESFSETLLTVDISSSATMSINASADGSFESAIASGIHVVAPNMTGTVANHGTMTVHASAPDGFADSYGILIETDSFTGTVGNYGSIVATTEQAVPATSYGIVINTAESSSGSTATVENNGLISADVAISTRNAPGPNQINQLGGSILGDILLSDSFGDTVDFSAGIIEGDTSGIGGDDVFNFRAGSGNPQATYIGNLDGLSSINVYPGMGYLDGSVTSTAAFNVFSGGALTLSSNGPTQVNVDSYTQVSGGLLVYEITPDPTSAAQINASSVSLDGAVTVAPLPGFYPNMVTYEEVVVSSGPTGQWATVVDTALLDVEAIYQGDNTVDLSITRIPFDEAEGLNENQQSIASGIEEIYESSEGTPFGEAIEEFFALDPDAYRDLLASLGGAEYAQGLQSLLDSQRMFQGSVLGHLGHGNAGGGGSQSARLGQFEFLSSQTAAAAVDEAGAAPRQQQVAAAEARGRESGSVSIWARAYGNFGDNDGDSTAVGYEQTQYGFVAGADLAVSENAVVGLAGGYSDNRLDFDNDNELDYEGFQVAAYGSFSPGPWYLDAMVSYAWYDNDSRRAVTRDTAKGDYDSEVFTAYAETGYGFELMPVTITPFFGLGYAHAETDSFTESGAAPFNLSVSSGDADSLTTTLGVELEARMQLSWEVFIVPKLRLGWEHEFEDDQQSIGASFAGAPASGFTVLSSQVADDSALIGAGFAVEMGQTWQLFLDYDGKLNEDYEQHAVSGGVKLTW